MALGAENDKIEFAESIGEFGVASGKKELVKDDEIKAIYIIQQRRLTDVLVEQKITDIDFISIDVEGYEFDVLNGIDFEQIKVKCFVIENDEGGYPRLELREYMREKGYKFVGRLMIDDVFLRNT